MKLIKPIKTKKEYGAALSFIDEYFNAKRGTPEASIVEVLTLLVEKYEEEHFPIDAPDPIEAIKFRMEQMGWTRKELVLVIGSKSKVSEVMNYRKSLSLPMIRRITHKMNIPAEVLIQES